MKSYTSLEQSRKLAKILPLESADMYWDFDIQKKEYYPMVMDDQFDDTCICAWSLVALLDVLPNNEDISINLSKGGYRIPTIEYPNNWFVDYEDETNGLNNRATSADNPVDACYEMIIKLNELKML